MVEADHPSTLPGRLEEEPGLETARLRAAIGSRLFDRVEAPPRIGRFTVLEPIGSGGMGVVYAAYDPQLDRRIALKLLRTSEGDEASRAAARLLREAQAMARVSHPNVIVVHEAGVHEGAVYIAMEYVPGGTLATWCERHPVAGEQRFARLLDLATQAVRGLAAAHEVGLVHRDLKPANLLVDERDRLRIADFGLARSATERLELPETANVDAGAIDPDRLGSSEPTGAERLTATGALVGTPAYMPPEQLEGRSDARSDQWSLCAAFWEAAYGARPFAADSFAASVAARIEGRLIVPGGHPEVPRWFRELLTRGLAPDPADRFADMPALYAALERGRGRKRRRRRVTLVIAGSIALAWASWPRPPVEEVSPCLAADRGLDDVWNPERADDVRAALAVPGGAGATSMRVEERVEAFAERWRDGAQAACERARTRGEIADAEEDVLAIPTRSMGCFRDTRVQLDAVLEALPTAGSNQEAVMLIQALPSLRPCENDIPGPAFDLGAGREAADALARATAARAMRKVDATRAHLERASAALEGRVVPNLEARLHMLQSSTHYQLDEFDAALASARDGLRAAEAGDDDNNEVSAWLHLADAARGLGDLDTAGFYVERAAARSARAGDPLWVKVRVVRARASVALARDDNLNAHADFVRAREGFAELYGTDNTTYVGVLRDSAEAARRVGRFDEAIEAVTHAIEISIRLFGEDHTETLRAKSTLASMLSEAGEDGRAVEILDEIATAVVEDADLGIVDRVTAIALHAQALGRLRRFDEAQARLSVAADLVDQSLGPDHSLQRVIAELRAAMALDAGDHAAAIALLEPLRAVPFEGGHRQRESALTVCINLAVAHARSGDAAAARSTSDDCRQMLTSMEVLDPVRHGSAYRYVGEAYHRAGRTADARDAYTKAVELLQSATVAQVEAAEAHLGLAELLFDTGDRAGAAEQLARAQASAVGGGDDLRARVRALAARLPGSAAG